MEQQRGEVWDVLEGLPPILGDFRTPTIDVLTRTRARATRVQWYALAVLAALSGAFTTQWVYRTTGGYYPFISGLVMVTCLLGGFGPAIIASLGSMILAHLLPPVGAMFPQARGEEIRFFANVFLLLVASILCGQFRRSRLATLEREARLQRAAGSVRELLDESSDAITLTDDALRITYVNARAEQMFGYKSGEVLGRPVTSIITQESLQKLPLQLEELKTGRTVRSERTVHRADGSVFEVDISARLLSGGRLLTSIRDVTEKKREAERQQRERASAESALRERDRRLEQITEAMPGMVYQYIMDADGKDRFTFVSPYSVELLGATPEAVRAAAEKTWMMIHPADVSHTQESVMQSFHSMQPWMHEFRIRDHRMQGAWRWVSGRALPQPGPDAGSVLWNGIFVDITDRKVLEESLRQAQKIESVGRLAGSIAHDFNNLLTVILGQSELLEMDLERGSDGAEGVAQIRAAAESGSSLTRQLLGFARKQVTTPKVVDINSLARRVPQLVGRLLGENVMIHLTLMENAPRVRVDPAQFDQVLVNLAVNARDAMPGGGRIEIRTSFISADAPSRAALRMIADGPIAEISVHDAGVGMSESVRDRAFEPFFTTKGIGKGTGLGLATSYGIVSQAGGTIVIDSAEGVGTTMRVLLPATFDALTPVEPERETPQHTGTETVLVVDDDEAVRAVTAAALRRQGYRVLESESGATAIARAKDEAGPIHLLVTDVVMPSMSGPALAAELARARPEMRVLYVSGYAEGAISQHGVLDAGVALLQKPYDIGTLAQRVRLMLETTD